MKSFDDDTNQNALIARMLRWNAITQEEANELVQASFDDVLARFEDISEEQYAGSLGRSLRWKGAR
jgi:hypothetical protein